MGPRMRTPPGTLLAWLREYVFYRGDDCLKWPFGSDTSGYGQCKFDGKIRRAHRLMCEFAHGPAPAASYEAAHSCGNGGNGCINPNHLSWKTHEENMADVPLHGKVNKKGKPRVKLSDAQVAEIRALKGKQTYREIAKVYGVNYRTIGLIIIGRDRPDRPKRSNAPIPEVRRTLMAAQARQLRAAGKSYFEIASTIGCGRHTAKALSLCAS